ncbi:MAG: HDOD domain-containing protein [Myxococcales bacterium]|nr:HDOD domain-containing protein [Myxococcales bacterium]MCB9649309.1 HDOD domain-containing protein [Deltaproteobacteria bacterium]
MHLGKLNPKYGKGSVTLEEEFIDDTEVRLRLEATFRSPDYKPPTLPSVALELLSLSQNPNADFKKVGKVLESDPIITGQVLRIAQSPVYAGRVAITTIPQALSRLGIKTLRDIVLQVALNARVFRAKPYQPTMESLQRHSMAVAHLARIISRYTPFEGEYAFLCGLLHDVGVAGSLIALFESNPKKPPALEDAWSAVKSVHAEASKLMVEQWKLPADIALTVGAHHSVLIQGYPHTMAAIVHLADELAKELGFTTRAEGAFATRNIETMDRGTLLQVLSLSAKQMELISKDALKHLEGLGG